MALYDRNYERFKSLVPVLGSVGDCCVSRVDGHLDLHLSVVERHKFTTVISLTHWFGEKGRTYADPDVRVRLYHDARMAEALLPGDQAESLQDPNVLPLYQLERKWQVNRFLEKWLDYSLEIGHRFQFVNCSSRRAMPLY